MKKILIILYTITLSLQALGQQRVSGVVYDSETKEPLIGAAVMVYSDKSGTMTNFNGQFTVETTRESDSVKISYVGYEQQLVAISSGNLLVSLKPSANNLEQIVITANREAALRTDVPVAISKLSPQTIQDTKPVLLAELLNKVPGVVMLNYNNEQHAMSIRQPMATSAYYLYLEDGVPVRPMGIFNHNALIEMNVLAISNIEVVKGPASSLYGPEAVGGAINFITHRPTTMPTAKVGILADQWGYQRLQYAASGTVGKRLGVFIGGLSARQQNAWQTYSDYNKSALNGSLEYLFTDKTKLTLGFSANEYYSDMAGSVDSLSFYRREYTSNTDFTYRKVHAQRTRLTMSHQWNDNHSTTITLAYRDNYIEQNPNYAIRWQTGSNVASGEKNRNTFYSRVALVQHVVNFNFLNARLLTGGTIDYSPTNFWSYKIDLAARLRADGKSVERYSLIAEQPEIFLSNYRATLQNHAMFTQFEINPSERVRVTAGLRYDNMAFVYDNYLDQSSGKKAFNRLTPKIGLTYDLLYDKGIYANFSQGFSPPGLTSIFRKKPGAQSTADFYYDLEPARFNNVEAGGWGSFLDDKLYVDFALYQMTGRNELLNIRQPDNSTDFQSAGRTLHRGAEYSVTYKPTKEWQFRFGGTNAVHRFNEFVLSNRATDQVKNVNGNDMPQAPRWVANSEVTYKPVQIKGLMVSLEWQRISSWHQNQVNTIRYEDRGFLGFKGVSYLNARMSYQWKKLEIFSNVLNVTNELYANAATRGNASGDRTTFTPAAPRTIVIGLQYNIANEK